jgi:uncharacterized protein (DUF1800 family)
MNIKQILKRGKFGRFTGGPYLGTDLEMVHTMIYNYKFSPPPVKTYNNTDYPSFGDGDEAIPQGQTWVNHIATSAPVKEARRASFKNWWMAQILTSYTLEEKMVFFWHNHFGADTDDIYESHIIWDYHSLLRTHATGNFRELMKDVTLNAAMLIFLNGDGSLSGDPNLNYAREVLERYTVGLEKYTERDIEEAAEMLAGFEVNRANGSVSFVYDDFDDEPKQFSEHFGYARVVPEKDYNTKEGGPNELIDLIFQSQERNVADFIVRKLLSYFVANTEHPNEVVDHLAQVFIDNDWEMKPLLMELFLHPYFSKEEFIGCQVKSPLELVASVATDFNISLPTDKPYELYRIMGQLRKKCAEMGLDLGEPPSVKGWDAYTQAPDFDQLWHNSDAAVIRAKFLESLFDPWTFQLDPPYTFAIDVLEFTKSIPEAQDPSILISTVVYRMFPFRWEQERLDRVKTDTLLGGLTDDGYWIRAWNRYLQDPNETNTAVVKERLTVLYKYLLSLDEYQIQ